MGIECVQRERYVEGWCYVLTNEFMPGIVKIGWTSRTPEERSTELSTTGVPGKYQIEYSARITEADLAEKHAHLILRSIRVDPSREHFRCEVLDAIAVVRESAERFGLLEQRFHRLDREEKARVVSEHQDELRRVVENEMEAARHEARKQAEATVWREWVEDQQRLLDQAFANMSDLVLPKKPFLPIALVSCLLVTLPALILFPGGEALALAMLAGIIFAVVWWGFRNDLFAESATAKSLREQISTQKNLVASRQGVICKECHQFDSIDNLQKKNHKCSRCGKWTTVPTKVI